MGNKKIADLDRKLRSPFAVFQRLINSSLLLCQFQKLDGVQKENGQMATDGITISWFGSASGSSGAESAASIGASGRALAAPDDRMLVERAQTGDREAFEILVHRYDRDVLRIALNILRKTEDARDVYQEAFLKIYKNLPRFRFECSFYTWLYRIVTNVCLDHLRRRSSRPEDQSPDPALQLDGDATVDFFDRQQQPGAASDPERRLMGLEIGRRISTALEQLTPRERMVFEMKHYQGLKLRVIGEMLGTTEETVKNSLFRATRKLRAQLEELL
jgi:RNA polymerase sigma-70 factor (ECF subfamily)